MCAHTHSHMHIGTLALCNDHEFFLNFYGNPVKIIEENNDIIRKNEKDSLVFYVVNTLFKEKESRE